MDKGLTGFILAWGGFVASSFAGHPAIKMAGSLVFGIGFGCLFVALFIEREG